MRKNSTLAIWLTLIMLLLVSAAAVFFLFQRNAQLEKDLRLSELEHGRTEAAAMATRDNLSSDLAVRQAALDAAAATRDTLEAEAELRDQRAQELESAQAQQEQSLAEAEAALQSLSLQAFIVSPADGATVPPLEELDIIVTARANAGLNTLLITADHQEIARLPADGQNVITAQANWTPPDEGTFVIGAEALALDGLLTTADITVNAAFASIEAENTARQRQLEEAVADLRFPVLPESGEATPEIAAEAASLERDPLHRPLLTGRITDDEQTFADEALTLQALDLLISDAGLRAYLNSVVAQGLSAYYDPAGESLTIYEPETATGVFGRWQSIHELAHDLQREHLGLDAIDIYAMDGDERLAFRALVEGDAVFLQHLVLQEEAMPGEDVAAINSGLSESATDATAALPGTLQDTFEFAFTAGVPFVQYLYDQEGYQAVNLAWSELPASSEQIIHPERYLAQDMPVPVRLVSLSDVLGEGWRLVSEDAFGEFLLRQHLGRQPLSDAAIDLAATGWGGGRYAVYSNEDSEIPLVLLYLAWDTEEDEAEFSELYADYLERRYGGEERSVTGDGRCWLADGAGCLFSADGSTLVIRAPDLELATAAAQAQLNMSQP